MVVRNNFKRLYSQINFPVYKDYLCRNFKWFASHAKFFENNGKNDFFGHIAFCIVRLIFLFIKITFAGILSGLLVMRIFF